MKGMAIAFVLATFAISCSEGILLSLLKKKLKKLKYLGGHHDYGYGYGYDHHYPDYHHHEDTHGFDHGYEHNPPVPSYPHDDHKDQGYGHHSTAPKYPHDDHKDQGYGHPLPAPELTYKVPSPVHDYHQEEHKYGHAEHHGRGVSTYDKHHFYGFEAKPFYIPVPKLQPVVKPVPIPILKPHFVHKTVEVPKFEIGGHYQVHEPYYHPAPHHPLPPTYHHKEIPSYGPSPPPPSHPIYDDHHHQHSTNLQQDQNEDHSFNPSIDGDFDGDYDEDFDSFPTTDEVLDSHQKVSQPQEVFLESSYSPPTH